MHNALQVSRARQAPDQKLPLQRKGAFPPSSAIVSAHLACPLTDSVAPLLMQFSSIALPGERLRDLTPQRLRMLPMKARKLATGLR